MKKFFGIWIVVLLICCAGYGLFTLLDFLISILNPTGDFILLILLITGLFALFITIISGD